jgi:hypothetical protein
MAEESTPNPPIRPSDYTVRPEHTAAQSGQQADTDPLLHPNIQPTPRNEKQRKQCRPDQTPLGKQILEVTAIAVVFAYTTYAALQWRVMYKAQRPWVGVVLERVTIKKPPPGSTAQYNNLAISMTVKNYGSSPALWVDPEFRPIWDRREVRREQETKTCPFAAYRESGKEAHAKGFGEVKGFGQTIFPQSTLPWDGQTGFFPLWPPPFDHPPRNEALRIWVSGCIVYRDQNDDVYQTRWCVYSPPVRNWDEFDKFLDGEGGDFIPCNDNQSAD